jgi:hypothetical protein
MAGRETSSIIYAMAWALPSPSSSPRLLESLEDSLNRVRVVVMVVLRKMKRHLYFQLIENKFTGSFKLSMLSIVIPVMALALEETHCRYATIHLTKRMVQAASQTGIVMVPFTE